jgi:hypothetical protein
VSSDHIFTRVHPGSRPSRFFGPINVRRFLGSPLIVVGKGLKLKRNSSVGHSFGSAEQSLGCFQIFSASSWNLEPHEALAQFSGHSSKLIGANTQLR